ncbi:hypothetical protein J6590_029456 [Homalodisca vitripennis]|nr:hypothetical protein J6590_029456 [Homalodisca vitripennis]
MRVKNLAISVDTHEGVITEDRTSVSAYQSGDAEVAQPQRKEGRRPALSPITARAGDRGTRVASEHKKWPTTQQDHHSPHYTRSRVEDRLPRNDVVNSSITTMLSQKKKLVVRVTERHVTLVRSVAARGGTIAAILMSERFPVQFSGYMRLL